MKALVVGAGAVGHAYAWHLQRGSRIYRLPTFGAPRPDTFTPDEVLTASDQVAARDWDLVVLAVSTPALSGGWAWWTPPVGAAPLSGRASRADPVAELLTAGGSRERRRRGFSAL